MEAAIRAAAAAFDETFGTPPGLVARPTMLVAKQGQDTWKLHEEDEFFARYPHADDASYHRGLFGDGRSEIVSWAELKPEYHVGATRAAVKTDQDNLGAGQRKGLLAVMRVLDDHEER